jgi:hypothetical protein
MTGNVDRAGVSYPAVGLTLDALARDAARAGGLRRDDVWPGDVLLVETRNSSYAIDVLDRGAFAVSGGWFHRNGIARGVVGIAGCTWGGHAILTDMLAAPGMFLEFDNGVRTTRIRNARVAGRRGPAAFN